MRRAPSSPFVGLAPYREEDAEYFFGRESETRVIIANLRSERFTVLYGPSGVGKSSVLGAGVLPELRRQVLRHRRSAAAGGDGRVPFAVTYFLSCRPGRASAR
jgi:ABC-type taurine transport system ATPase subunit